MGNIENLLKGKLSIKEAHGLIWRHLKGELFEQIHEDYPNLDRGFIYSIVTGLNGGPLRKNLFKMWENRNKKIEGSNETWGERFERTYLGWKKGGK